MNRISSAPRKKKSNKIIYSPESSLRYPGRMFVDMFHDLVSGRELAWQLAVRDIRAQYRQTALGLLWAFIMPLAHTVTWIFLSGSGIVTVKSTELPYPVYVFTGTMIWAIFMDAVNAPLQKTVSAKQMLAKVNFPREAIVISGIYQTLFNGLIKVVILVSALMLLGFHIQLTVVMFLFGTISLILAGTAIGLMMTPVGLLYTDVGKSLPLFLQFLMYITPVVFPMPKNGWAAIVYELNPLTPLVLTTRAWLTGNSPDHLSQFIWVNAIVICILIAVWIIYRIAMPILIERMSS